MEIVTLTTIVAWEFILLYYAFVLHISPLKDYTKNIAKVQLAFSSGAVLLGIVCYLCIINGNYDSEKFYGSNWDAELAIYFIIAYCFFFGLALVRFVGEKKIKTGKEEIFQLKAGDYKILKEFNLTMGDYMYMPNVKSYCEFEKGMILFTGQIPSGEVDCRFTCRMLKDGIYECLSYEVLSGKDKNDILYKISGIVFILLAAIDIVIFGIWLSQDTRFHMDIISKLLKGLSLILFGSVSLKLYYGAKGIMAKMMFAFSIMLILLEISLFF